jgi:hypothetical protein
VRAELELAESRSRKYKRDWYGTRPIQRIDYLHRACAIERLREHIFFHACSSAPTACYPQVRADSVQSAIGKFASRNRRAIHYEGLTRSNRESLFYELRRRGLRSEIRNARFHKYPEVRLADALAGMIAKVRFGTDGPDYAHLLKDWFVEIQAGCTNEAPANPHGFRGRP